jgi:hypothetical protein
MQTADGAVGKPDIVAVLVGVDRNRMRAVIVGAVNQHVVNAGLAHFT